MDNSQKRANFLKRKASVVNYGKLGATKKAFIGPKRAWVNIAPLPSNNAIPVNTVKNNTRKIKALNLPQFGSHDGGRRKKTHRKRR